MLRSIHGFRYHANTRDFNKNSTTPHFGNNIPQAPLNAALVLNDRIQDIASKHGNKITEAGDALHDAFRKGINALDDVLKIIPASDHMSKATVYDNQRRLCVAASVPMENDIKKYEALRMNELEAGNLNNYQDGVVPKAHS